MIIWSFGFLNVIGLKCTNYGGETSHFAGGRDAQNNVFALFLSQYELIGKSFWLYKLFNQKKKKKSVYFPNVARLTEYQPQPLIGKKLQF